jgi:hypothetical protein
MKTKNKLTSSELRAQIESAKFLQAEAVELVPKLEKQLEDAKKQVEHYAGSGWKRTAGMIRELEHELERALRRENDATLPKVVWVEGTHSSYNGNNWIVSNVTAKSIVLRQFGDERRELFNLDGTSKQGYRSSKIDLKATFGRNL